MAYRGRRRATAATMMVAASLASPAVAQETADSAIAALLAETSADTAVATARQQIAAGELLAGAATLERALLANPDADEARLLYAATLCRLGDPQGARVEIGKLSRRDLGPAAWSEVNAACGTSVSGTRPVASAGSLVSGEAYAGLAYDSDSAGALALQFDFGPGTVDREGGVAAIAGLRVDFHAPQGGGLTGSLSGVSKHELGGPDLDYTIMEGRLGYGGGGDGGRFGLGGVGRHITLLGRSYVTELGGQGEWLLGNPAGRRFRLRGEAVHQNYHHDFPFSTADGMRYDLSAAIETPVGSRGAFLLGAAGELKKAEVRGLGYRGGRLFAVTQLAVGESGQYLNLSGTLRYIDFRNQPFSFDRKDTRAFARAAYGVPLAGQLYLEGAGSYTLRSVKLSSPDPCCSAPDPATYRSVGGEARLLFKF